MLMNKNDELMKNKKIITILICAILIIAGIIVYTLVILPDTKYSNAVKAMQNKRYDEASAAFQELKGYKDYKEKVRYRLIPYIW